MPLHGVDVSHHNDPLHVPTDVDFAIVRISYGTAHDERAEEHLARLANVGALVAYHYLVTAQIGASGEEQAAVFLERHADLQARFGPLGLAVDSEPLPGAPWDPVDRVRGRLLGFAASVLSSGQPCLVYGSRDWFARLNLPAWIAARFPFWAASAPPPPAPWTTIAIQQAIAPVAGIDRDTLEGSIADLRALLGLPPDTLPAGCALPGPL